MNHLSRSLAALVLAARLVSGCGPECSTDKDCDGVKLCQEAVCVSNPEEIICGEPKEGTVVESTALGPPQAGINRAGISVCLNGGDLLLLNPGSFIRYSFTVPKTTEYALLDVEARLAGEVKVTVRAEVLDPLAYALTQNCIAEQYKIEGLAPFSKEGELFLEFRVEDAATKFDTYRMDRGRSVKEPYALGISNLRLSACHKRGGS